MHSVIAFLLGFFGGGITGFVITAVIVAHRDEDDLR